MERVLTGAFAPGARIDVNEIAAADGVSPTPVRNALNRLVGAGLLVSHSNEGFFAPLITEQDLRDLYEASAALLSLAISRRAIARSPPAPVPSDGAQSGLTFEQRTDAAFRRIMLSCGNMKLCGAFAHISLRLTPARLLEGEWIANRNGELGRIVKAYDAGDLSRLDQLITNYHRRRIRFAPKIVARLQGAMASAFIDDARVADRDD